MFSCVPVHKITRFTFPTILKGIAANLDLNNGKKLHARILEFGLQFDCHIASSLINLYVKCGSFDCAGKVFDQLPQRDVAVWNSMLSGFFHHSRLHDGLALLSRMQRVGFKPDACSLCILLGACSGLVLDLRCSKVIHAFVFRNAFDGEQILETALIDAYSKLGLVKEAYKVFDRAMDKNVLLWNAMIRGFCYNGLSETSLELFVLMMNKGCEMQASTFTSVLSACSAGKVVSFGQGVHCCVIKKGHEFDPYVGTSLLTMYAEFGSVYDACKVFHGVKSDETEFWNSMISAYLQNSCVHEALGVYKQMRFLGVGLDSITLSNLLSACAVFCLKDLGKTIHGELVKRPVLTSMIVQSSLMTMYIKNRDVEAADALFSSHEDHDIVVWGTMISGFCQNKKLDNALSLFHQLMAKGLKPDSAVIASVLSASSSLGCLQLGYQFHGLTIKNSTAADVYVGSGLIDMYAKFGMPKSSECVLSDIPYKNLVVYNSMISCYGRNGMVDDSIKVLAKISQLGLTPDSISITSSLASVSSLAALAKGKMIHGYQVRNQILTDALVENTLLDMYMKCGCLRYARRVFDRMTFKNLAAWNTVITGYGSHGHCIVAFELFEEMKRYKVSPDDTTFLSLISSCSHSGLVKQGMRIFDSMLRDHSIVPRMEHYVNMVDLFSRAGWLSEAYQFIKQMPIEPTEGVYLCLLSACRIHRNKVIGQLAADHLLKLQPEESGSYTQLLNFFNEMGLLDRAAKLRMQLKDKGTKKIPGCSWIEINNNVQVFYSGDSSFSLGLIIHETLTNLKRTMRGYDDDDDDDDDSFMRL
ncbi:Tetratricopeptide-like helical domain-containing protein [Dioscorea alata]|uniref:Tetratricopeptide-like helical domain-containing protein n=1 Tax=Dioscorea alata TaxID=55571 RepID=A0ACB7VFH1_DIOAL|nr:Tetratricopeptide-like helical domain-containing protein [Dioscorea alata]